jgi:hypothetical protein
MIAWVLITLLVAFVAAGAHASVVQEAARLAPATEMPMPFNAIEIDEGLFMVPVSQDRTGCPLYSLQTHSRAVLEVYFYQTSAGDFTTDRRQASC